MTELLAPVEEPAQNEYDYILRFKVAGDPIGVAEATRLNTAAIEAIRSAVGAETIVVLEQYLDRHVDTPRVMNRAERRKAERQR